jgi:hypothetical protein
VTPRTALKAVVGGPDRRLIALGLGMLPIYGLVTLLSGSFRYGEGHRERPILAVLALFTIAWVGYATALATVLGRHRGRPRGRGRRRQADRRLPTVIAFAIASRALLLASTPIQEIDYYRYLWDGRVVIDGMDPFRHAPAEVDRIGPDARSRSVPGRLWGLSRSSEAVRTIFERIHHREVPTIYPPASQAVFAASALLTPPSAPLGIHVLVLKCLLVGFDLGTVLLLAGLLRRVGLPVDWCLAYGWCPLVLKEIANTAHLDAIAVFFTVLAAYWLVGGPGRGREAMLGAASLGVAVLAKGYPVLLLPPVAAFLVARMRGRAAVPLVISCLVVLVGYAPFAFGEQGAGATHSPWTGLRTFLARWQKNDFLFMLMHENLRPPEPGGHDRWFVVVPGPPRMAVNDAIAVPLAEFVAPGADPSFMLTQAVMGGIVGTIVLAWSCRVWRSPRPRVLLRGFGLILVWGWLLSSTPHPWYLTWSLPFLVFEGRRSWFLLPGLVFIYYLRFWFEYRALDGGPDAVASSLERFDYGMIWLEFLPFLTAIALESRGG